MVGIKIAQPNIQIELLSTNKVSDLIKREADIAIRVFRPTQQDLIVKKLVDGTLRLFASKSYLDLMGHPKEKSELAKHQFVNLKKDQAFTFSFPDALEALGVSVKEEQFSMITGFGSSYLSLIKAGAGIGILPNLIGLREPELVAVFPELSFLTLDLWLVCHRELRTSNKIRFVFDYIAEHLSNRLRLHLDILS